MNVFLTLDFFNNLINKVFRDIPDSVRYIVILVLLALSFYCLAKTFNLKKDADKAPVKYGFLVLFALFFAICMCFVFLR